jgi:ankyrin repeat protein
METTWSENQLDNSLHEEIMKKDTDKNKVNELITSGANINATSKYGDSLLKEVISNWEADGGNVKFEIIKLLIDLGIDINHTIEGFNCLFDAWFRYNYDLVEFLLKNGANPNCISTDTDESLLDWIEWDRHFEVDLEGSTDEQWIEKMDKIIKLLKSYGAKTKIEINVDKNYGKNMY